MVEWVVLGDGVWGGCFVKCGVGVGGSGGVGLGDLVTRVGHGVGLGDLVTRV